MPSIYTHYNFGLDVLKKLDKKTSTMINGKNDYYNLFNESFDTLYYYNFLSLKKGKNIREFAHYMHRSNSTQLFLNIINYIKDNNLEDNKEVICFLYGLINHYSLDTTMHPYLNYKSGRFNKLDKSTKKYKGIHTNMELMIDRYFYETTTNKNWNDYKIYNDFLKDLNFSNELKNTIDDVFYETFNKQNMAFIFEKSNKDSRTIYKLLVKDKYGIKKFLYSLVDLVTPSKKDKYKSYSWHVETADEFLLNNEHRAWCNPIDNDIMYEDSLMDLYNKATHYSLELIKEINNVIYRDKKIDKLVLLLGNKNYETGYPIEDKRILKYFEF